MTFAVHLGIKYHMSIRGCFELRVSNGNEKWLRLHLFTASYDADDSYVPVMWCVTVVHGKLE